MKKLRAIDTFDPAEALQGGRLILSRSRCCEAAGKLAQDGGDCSIGPRLHRRSYGGFLPEAPAVAQELSRSIPSFEAARGFRCTQALDLAAALVWIWVACAPSVHAEIGDPVPPKQTNEPSAATYRWFSLPIQVSGIPARAEFVPVSCPIDFTEILSGLNVSGAVDERSLRLHRLSADGREAEEPLQFLPSPQPRPKEKRSLPDTPPNVSYLGEYAAGETPTVPRVAGELIWIARGTAGGVPETSGSGSARSIAESRVRYRLEFGIPRGGRFIQVPFPPQNLRAFDDQGRAAPVRWFSRMQIRPQWPAEGVVQILDNNQVMTAYHIGRPLSPLPNAPAVFRRPFLHPVNGPDGISLTEFGKPHDPTGSHAHHYALWIAHASVDGKDFWSEKGGLIAHEEFESMEDGPLFCRLIQKTRWLENGAALLREKRQLTFYHTPETFRLIDVELELTPGSAKPVVFGKTSFGFLAARVAQSMTVFDGGGEILNSKGARNEQAAHLQRADWIDQSGPIAPDKWNGIALLDHPDNANHPTGWHCRNDGWAGAAFNMDNPYTLDPGAKLRLRYRVHLHRGNSVEGEVGRRYEEYCARPTIQLNPAATK